MASLLRISVALLGILVSVGTARADAANENKPAATGPAGPSLVFAPAVPGPAPVPALLVGPSRTSSAPSGASPAAKAGKKKTRSVEVRWFGAPVGTSCASPDRMRADSHHPSRLPPPAPPVLSLCISSAARADSL